MKNKMCLLEIKGTCPHGEGGFDRVIVNTKLLKSAGKYNINKRVFNRWIKTGKARRTAVLKWCSEAKLNPCDVVVSWAPSPKRFLTRIPKKFFDLKLSERGLNIYDLARSLKVSRSTAWRWLNTGKISIPNYKRVDNWIHTLSLSKKRDTSK